MPRKNSISDQIGLRLELAVIDTAIDITSKTVTRANSRTPVDTRELLGSARVTINKPSTDQSSEPYIPLTEGDIRRAAQIGGMSIGDSLVTTWVARHALIAEGGRRVGSKGWMIGSEQAPDGYVDISMKEVLAQR